MRWKSVCIESIAVSLPEERISTRELEVGLAPAYDKLHLKMGQVEALTGSTAS